MTHNGYAAEAVELLKRLIATPSTSRDESRAADVMTRFMRERDIDCRRVKNNVYAICPDYDKDKKTVLLNAHIDTVKPAASWTRDPFTPTVDNGKLYGLGSNDCGGGLVSLLQTFRIITGRKRSFNVIFLASAEEEVSGNDGICSVLPLLPHVDVALVGEPTGMQPAIAEKGLMVIDATAHGRAGHAARNEGINAIYVAMDDIDWLKAYKFEKVSTLLGPVKATVTIINAGTQHNVVPDLCRFVIDVRTNELYTNKEAFDILQKGMGSELTARSFRLNSSMISPDHPLVKRMTAAGMTPFGSPTLSDQALLTCPSVKLGPGDSARSHAADEYIRLSEISDAIDTYVALLTDL